MRNAYGLLGVLFLIVFVGAYLLVKKSEEPSLEIPSITQNNIKPHMNLMLSSPSFLNDGLMPAESTCDGSGISPELHIQDVPAGTESLVLLVEDIDIPEEIKKARAIEKFDHWVLFNIPADTTLIKEGEPIGTSGLSSRGTAGYVPPCPPPEYAPSEHRYVFTLYALSKMLSFKQMPALDEVRAALSDSILGEATLIGKYERMNNL